MCEKVNLIAEYENGTAIYDGQKINKFQKILNIKFEK
jgi:ribosome-binding protein aMBF1 (putative translation factor)